MAGAAWEQCVGPDHLVIDHADEEFLHGASAEAGDELTGGVDSDVTAQLN